MASRLSSFSLISNMGARTQISASTGSEMTKKEVWAKEESHKLCLNKLKIKWWD